MAYLRPVADWIVNELKYREAAPELAMFKQPFAILTSAAVVARNIEPARDTDGMYRLYANGEGASYKGCIIGNIIDPELQYGKETNIVGAEGATRSIVGLDFDAKYIYTEGDVNRRVPIPIIEKVDVNGDGENAALKEATVVIRCFSLKQLEMLELFFCRPLMNVMLEYGNNFEITGNQIEAYKTYLRGTGNTTVDSITHATYQSEKEMALQSIIVPKTSHKEFCESIYNKYHSMNEDSTKEYMNKVYKSNGQYDVFAGRVSDFSYSIGTDNTYELNLQIQTVSAISLALPSSNVSAISKIEATANKAGVILTLDDLILKTLQADFRTPDLKIDKDTLLKHTFNFVRPNDSEKARTTSTNRYISLHLLLEHMVNFITTHSIMDRSFALKTKHITVGGKSIPAIVCHSHKKIISSTDVIIFPGKLPTIRVGGVSPQLDTLILDDTNPTDVSINGLSFNFTESEIKVLLPDFKTNNDRTIKFEDVTFTSAGNSVLGNALNIFIHYEKVTDAWAKSTTRADFLATILSFINDNGYNLFNLIVAPNLEGGYLTIQDSNFSKISNTVRQRLVDDKIYRFKVGTINSIVKAFNFEMTLSDAHAAGTIFQQAYATKAVLGKTSSPQTAPDEAILQNINRNAIYTYYKNPDGFISTNPIEINAILKSFELQKQQDVAAAEEAKKTKKAQATPPKDTKKENTTQKKPNAVDPIDSKVTRFVVDGKNAILILKDSGVILESMNITQPEDQGVMSDFKCTLTIDGLSGLTFGEMFRVDGIPEIYNKLGAFQVTQIKNSIAGNMWDTTIEAGWRPFMFK